MTEEVRYRLRQQAAVAELGMRALTSKDMTRLMNEAAALGAMGLSVEYCKILELLPDEKGLLLRAGVGWKKGTVDRATVSAGKDSQAGYTLLSEEPVIVEDLRREKRFTGPPLLKEHGVISGLSVIIHGKERPFGVLGAHSRQARQFTTDDINFLQSIANILAAAIERRKTEEILHDTESRYRNIVENAIDGIFQTTPEGRFISVNPSMAKMFGYDSPEDMVQSVTNMAAHLYVDREQRKEILRLLNEREIVRGYEGRVRRKDGSVIWVSSNIRAVRDEEGNPLFYEGFTQDITGRKQVEEVFRNIAEGVSAVTGETFFRSLVEYLAKSLDVDFALVGELLEEDKVRTIAIYARGEFADNFEYDLEGSPCKDVMGNGICSYPAGVSDKFPQDEMLKQMGIESYIGTPLRDSAGHTLGIMIVMDGEPVENAELAESMLRIFAVRASAELERKRSEEELRLLQTLTMAIGQADDFNEAIEVTLKKVCEVTGWMIGEAWIPREDGAVLNSSVTWFGVTNGLKEFREQSKTFVFKPGEGLPGRVWLTRKPAWVKDVTEDDNFPRAEIAKKAGLKTGVSIPVLLNSEVIAILDFFIKEAREEEERFVELVSAAATQLGAVIDKKRADEKVRDSVRRLQSALSGVIGALASTVERRDPYTAGHQQRVSKLAAALAQEMGLPEERVEGLRMAGTLHDLGKIAVPAEILSKPGTISEFEFSIIKNHPQVAYEILKEIEFPWPIARIVLEHHERLDGSGYPQGLSDGEIMLEARIMAVADTVEAMASHRPYRPSLGMKAALEEIKKYKGKLYDADAVNACIHLCYEKDFKLD